MITKKSIDDIKALKHAGKILATALSRVLKEIRPGVKTKDLDDLAQQFLRDNGTTPSFKGYGTPPYPTTLCTSINEQVVHTPASNRELQNGDIIGVDIGLRYHVNGRDYFVDMAKTVPVGRISRQTKKLIAVTKESLERGISQMKPGNTIADISRAIQEYVKPYGYGIIRKLVGHGVGFAVHEEPKVPNFIDGKGMQIPLEPGMVLAIEPMLTLGGDEIKTLNDNWTIVTADGSLSAHFEHTVAVTDRGHEVLTKK